MQPPGGQPPPYGGQPPPYGQPYPPYGPPYGPGGYPYPEPRVKATGLEKGYLYGTAIAWGIGTGVWLDVEAEIENPGLAIIMPALFGAAAPVGVFIADTALDGFSRGVPAAIATGMWLGGGLGLGIWAVQSAVSSGSDEWGFVGLGRAAFVGSVVGGVGGGVIGALVEPSPKTSMFVLSASGWGTLVGGAFGGAASEGNWKRANDAVSVGGLIGYGVGLLGSSGASFGWTPSWGQIGAMWAGFGIGAAATTPIYLVYLAVDEDPRTGLIAQGIGGLIGIGAGALIGPKDKKSDPNYPGYPPLSESDLPANSFAQLLGIGPMVTESGGIGLQATGLLY